MTHWRFVGEVSGTLALIPAFSPRRRGMVRPIFGEVLRRSLPDRHRIAN